MSKMPDDKVDIQPEHFKIFFEELCERIIAQEFGGNLPKRITKRYGNGLFTRPKSGMMLYEYFNTTPEQAETPKAANYIYNFYADLDTRNIVWFDKYILINCLIYMGYSFTAEEDKTVSRKERAKILLGKFITEHFEVSENETINENQSAGKKGKSGAPELIPDPAFYAKLRYENLKKQREQLRKQNNLNGNINGVVVLACVGYCVYFLTVTNPYGNWWWFGGAALYSLLAITGVIVEQIQGGSIEERINDRAIMLMEEYLSTGKLPKDDSHLPKRLRGINKGWQEHPDLAGFPYKEAFYFIDNYLDDKSHSKYK